MIINCKKCDKEIMNVEGNIGEFEIVGIEAYCEKCKNGN